MEYNPEYVYFEPVNGMIDKWCLAADSVRDIKSILEASDDFIKGQLVRIKEVNKDKSFPFKVTCHDKDEPEVTEILMKFVYIDPVFQNIMRELHVGIGTDGHLTYSINSNKFKHVYYMTSSIEDAKEWITERLKFEDMMKAWENGAAIQRRESMGEDWHVTDIPTWNPDVDYRIMAEEKVLEWTDLKIGDVIRSKVNRNVYMQVQGIDKSDNTGDVVGHIFAGGGWKSDYDLANWEKVEG